VVNYDEELDEAMNARERLLAPLELRQEWRRNGGMTKWRVVKLDHRLKHVVIRSGARKLKMTWDGLRKAYTRWVSAGAWEMR